MGLHVADSGSKFKKLEDGRYDARILGIVGLGVQKQREYKGEAKPDIQKVKFIFDIPSQFSDEEEKETLTVTRSVPVSCGEKSNLNKILRASNKCELDHDECFAIVDDTVTLGSQLGKLLKVDVKSFKSDGDNTIVFASAWLELDKDLEARVPTSKRERFLFLPHDPDMKVWKDNLFYHIKEEIMSAVDVKEFPKELHKQWVADQEAEEVRKAEKDDKTTTTTTDESMGAIQ